MQKQAQEKSGVRAIRLAAGLLAIYAVLMACSPAGGGGQATEGPGGGQTPQAAPTELATDAPTGGAVGRIAFVSDRDGNSEIYVVDADGGNLARLTDDPADDDSPVWSPDGTRIAFTSERDGNEEIYVMDADGGNQTRLTNDPGNEYSNVGGWSPDGTRIAFDTQRDGNVEIYVMDADGGNLTHLPNMETGCCPAWSPDGTQIIFWVQVGFDIWDTYVMDADGGNQANLTNYPGKDSVAGWSPDGTRALLQSSHDDPDPDYCDSATCNVEIYLMDADGGNLTRLTDDPGYDGSPGWSPDGTRIVFTSERDGNFEIYVMDADGGNLTNLTNDAGLDILAKWSPDGTWIAFMSDRDGNTEIYVMDADGSNLTNLTDDPGSDSGPVWQPVP